MGDKLRKAGRNGAVGIDDLADDLEFDSKDPRRWLNRTGADLTPGAWVLRTHVEQQWSRRAVFRVLLYAAVLIAEVSLVFWRLSDTTPLDRSTGFYVLNIGVIAYFLILFALSFPRDRWLRLRRSQLDVAPLMQEKVDAMVATMNEQAAADARDGVGAKQRLMRDAYRIAALSMAAEYAHGFRFKKVRANVALCTNLVTIVDGFHETLRSEGRKTRTTLGADAS